MSMDTTEAPPEVLDQVLPGPVETEVGPTATADLRADSAVQVSGDQDPSADLGDLNVDWRGAGE